ncbi:bestrophin-like domain [Thalassovita mangrovi]|uniref:DUF4239 domain-containing protein n=1 Tax=Thalassovita mangrovi TaxID=2692236 RepID=A0A6L8LNH9_9RHOB|nr:hypothetical protein [Thalassovita mangrovi]MYM57123.1 hypothetical protein [Thalassovita mangrovi]
MLIGAAIIIATVAVVFMVYFTTRFLLQVEPEERTRDLAGSVLFRISALHGLVLALVFASEVVDYHQLAYESAVEVNAISDVYYDADRYGDEANGVRDALRDYLGFIPSQEWASLAQDGTLSGEAWGKWSAAYAATLDLVPATPRQEALRANMLKKIHVIAESRDLREYQAKSGLSSVFWIAALVGVLLVSVGYYTFPPKRDNLILIGIFAGYTGFILFTIYAMSNPYGAPSALEPTLFAELLSEVQG